MLQYAIISYGRDDVYKQTKSFSMKLLFSHWIRANKQFQITKYWQPNFHLSFKISTYFNGFETLETQKFYLNWIVVFSWVELLFYLQGFMRKSEDGSNQWALSLQHIQWKIDWNCLLFTIDFACLDICFWLPCFNCCKHQFQLPLCDALINSSNNTTIAKLYWMRYNL